MFIRTLFLFLSFLVISGCSSAKKDRMVTIVLKNATDLELKKASLDWDGPYVAGGYFSPGITRASIFVKWPFVANGKLKFSDAENQRHEIEVSFERINAKISSGECDHVVIQLTSLTSVEVLASPKP